MSSGTSKGDLPKGWKVVESKSQPGKSYYLHVKSGEKTWKMSHVHAKEKEFRRKHKSSHHNKNGESTSDEQVQVLHILAKHKGSRRPSSWRQENITRSKEVATVKIEGIKERLLACVQGDEDKEEGASKMRKLFEEIAREESDCSSAKHGGDLGSFGRGKMQKPFENAAFNLQVGELSELVETDSGIHVLLRVK